MMHIYGQKFLILMKPNLSIFFFLVSAFLLNCLRIFVIHKLLDIFVCDYYRSSIILLFIFRSKIHVEYVWFRLQYVSFEVTTSSPEEEI